MDMGGQESGYSSSRSASRREPMDEDERFSRTNSFGQASVSSAHSERMLDDERRPGGARPSVSRTSSSSSASALSAMSAASAHGPRSPAPSRSKLGAGGSGSASGGEEQVQYFRAKTIAAVGRGADNRTISGKDVPRQRLPMLPPPGAPQVVQCQWCFQTLAVPINLPPPKKGQQKLRCGKCLKVSRYAVFLPPTAEEDEDAEEQPPPQPPQPQQQQQQRQRRQKQQQGGGEEAEVAEEDEEQQALSARGRSASTGSFRTRSFQGNAQQQAGAMGAGRGSSSVSRGAGNIVPIPDRQVAEAERLAGPINPGTYWYDVDAGFWGVVGGPCLGIIPAGIHQLAVGPLQRQASGGRTRVVVNGRELHRRDLDILMQRGLADEPGVAYLLDIDGNLVDAATGEDLPPGLGKLAPSLEVKGRGAGMYVPK
ncbi:unnamed protein product [Closterium sp. Yama58-4]|nr:unnamed protein product [Closterium sp. Yama58-4]